MSFLRAEMRREEKPLKLTPVDDESSEPAPVVRLGNRETAAAGKDQKPVRLAIHEDEIRSNSASLRLDMPSPDDVELRTHQPGIEVLIEQEAVEEESMEQKWGISSKLRNPIPWGWFVLFGLVLAGAVIWALSGARKDGGQVKKIQGEITSAIEEEEMEIIEATELVEQIESHLRRFFDCTTVDAMVKLVRHPERVGPLIRAYHADKPVAGPRLRDVRVLQPLTMEGRGNFWMASVVLTDGGDRDLIIEINSSGEPLIDWETLVCHQPMPWEDFVSQRPSGVSLDFRVYVEEDNFYSHEFADSEHWACFRMTARDSEETLFGYLAADSKDLPNIRSLIRANGGRRVSVILRLLIPENLQSRRGVVIEKFLSPRWIYLEAQGDDP